MKNKTKSFETIVKKKDKEEEEQVKSRRKKRKTVTLLFRIPEFISVDPNVWVTEKEIAMREIFIHVPFKLNLRILK